MLIIMNKGLKVSFTYGIENDTANLLENKSVIIIPITVPKTEPITDIIRFSRIMFKEMFLMDIPISLNAENSFFLESRISPVIIDKLMPVSKRYITRKIIVKSFIPLRFFSISLIILPG